MTQLQLMGVSQGQTSEGGRRRGCGQTEVAHMQIAYSLRLLGGVYCFTASISRDANL